MKRHFRGTCHGRVPTGFANTTRFRRVIPLSFPDEGLRARVADFYNKRGTVEQRIKEGTQAVTITGLSCDRFRSNEVRLWLSVLAYNLGNLWRRLALPKEIENWSLMSLQQGW